MFKNPFSGTGRIRRLEYVITVMLYSAVFMSVSFLTIGLPYGKIIFWSIFLVITWVLVAQGAKRCHDIGVRGLYQFIPFYFFWMLVDEGQPKKNQYGLSPKGLKGPEETGKIRQNEG